MFTSIKTYCDDLTTEFDSIPSERKLLLDKITGYINSKAKEQKPINLIYVCTHNSRRSHFGQVWAHIAAKYYGIQNFNSFSGGTEATAFNPNAISALKRIGFVVSANKIETNPSYDLKFAENEKPIICFSKVYNDPQNPSTNFAAVMTCSDAEQNCPFIPGVEARIGTTYEDPKMFDGTPQQDEKYDERCRQIALETLYVFSKVQKRS